MRFNELITGFRYLDDSISDIHRRPARGLDKKNVAINLFTVVSDGQHLVKRFPIDAGLRDHLCKNGLGHLRPFRVRGITGERGNNRRMSSDGVLTGNIERGFAEV